MFLSSCRRAFCAFDTFDFVYVHELLRRVLEEDFFFCYFVIRYVDVFAVCLALCRRVNVVRTFMEMFEDYYQISFVLPSRKWADSHALRTNST